MTERELQKDGKLYRLDAELLQAHLNAKRITRLLNGTLETERSRRQALVQELFAQAAEEARARYESYKKLAEQD